MYIITSAAREDWKINEILSFIEKDSNKNRANIFIGANLQLFNIETFAFYAYKQGYYNQKIITHSTGANYIIGKTGQTDFLRRKTHFWFSNVSSKRKDYQLIEEFPLPDGSDALIYKKSPI